MLKVDEELVEIARVENGRDLEHALEGKEDHEDHDEPRRVPVGDDVDARRDQADRVERNRNRRKHIVLRVV